MSGDQSSRGRARSPNPGQSTVETRNCDVEKRKHFLAGRNRTQGWKKDDRAPIPGLVHAQRDLTVPPLPTDRSPHMIASVVTSQRIFVLVCALLVIQTLHVLQQLQQIMECVRCVTDRKVGEDLFVVHADFGLGQHLPHVLA